jgi:hypothetical protein
LAGCDFSSLLNLLTKEASLSVLLPANEFSAIRLPAIFVLDILASESMFQE